MHHLKAAIILASALSGILFRSYSYAQTDNNRDLALEPIVVSKYAYPTNVSIVQTPEGPGGYADALSGASVDVQSRSPIADIQSDYSIRGSTFQCVGLLLNGYSVSDHQTAHHNSDMPVTGFDLERIEVTRGITAFNLGHNAVAGSLNTVIKRPRENRNSIWASAGEYATFGQGVSVSGKIGQSSGIRASFENEQSEGSGFDTGFHKKTCSLTAAHDFANGSFNSYLGCQDKEFGAYDFYTPGKGYPSREWTSTVLSQSDLTIECDSFKIKPAFVYRRHFDKFMLDKTQVRSGSINKHYTYRYSPGVYVQYAFDDKTGTGAGFDYEAEQIISNALGKHTRYNRRQYADITRNIHGGLDWSVAATSDDYSDRATVLSAASAFSCRITPENTIDVSVAKSYRVPTFTEMYYSDPTTIGNPSVGPEKAVTYQAGFRHTNGNFSFATAVFLRRETGFLDWVKKTPSQSAWQIDNVSDASASGFEVSSGFKPTRAIQMDSAYSFVNKRRGDNGVLYKYGSAYTKHHITGKISYETPVGKPSIGIEFKKQTSGRDPWILVKLGYSVQLNGYVKFFSSISNLCNVEYQEIEGIPQPGRYAEAGIAIDW